MGSISLYLWQAGPEFFSANNTQEIRLRHDDFLGYWAVTS